MADPAQFGDSAAALDAFESLPFFVVVTDGPELRTVAFNAAARAVTDGRLVYGAPLMETLPKELTGQGWREAYAGPTLTGEAGSRDEHRIQVQQPDGTAVEIFIDTAFTPRFGADGQPRGTIMTARDVTASVQGRAAAQRELAELRERYAAAHGQARALQRAMLPESVPLLPHFDVAARYLLAPEEHVAGGDWFDAVARPDGSVVLVVGDVVGHGQTAAVVMGQLRAVLLSQLRAGAAVADALAFLDGFAAGLPGARHATVCVAAVDGASGLVEYCTAGHPPPLVVGHDDATTRYLPPSGAGPLTSGTGFGTATTRLDVGEVLVLVSDGLLERPGVPPAAATAQLRQTAVDAARNVVMPVGASPSAAERICSLSIELLTRSTGHRDDITIVAAQRRTPPPPLHVTHEVAPSAPGHCRAELRGWLEQLGAGPTDLEWLLHTVTELVTNVVDHAHAELPAPPLQVTAELTDDSTVCLQVADSGSWKIPMLTGQRGRGLALVRQLVDRLELDHRPDGTTASVEHRVSRPGGLLAGSVGTGRTPDEFFDVHAQGGPEPTIVVVGPLESPTVAEVAPLVALALTEAADTVLIDLSAATLLASSGVDLLFRVADQARSVGRRLDVLAPVGSPAQHVLSLVGFPHRTGATPD